MKNIDKISNIYKNKLVLITGHTGFKGSWLAIFLYLLGARVVGISKSTLYKNSHYHFIKKIFNKEYFIDLTDKSKTKSLITRIKPDFIFNLAAQSLVIKSYKDPYNTFYENFMITLNILDVIKNSNYKIIAIFITSDKSYKNINTKKPYKENDILGGDDPYSGSKGAIELLINSYFQSFFKNQKKIRIAVARAGNVIGGGDWSDDRIIPDTFKSWYKNKKIKIRNPNATRPWQHVIEPLYGYISLACNLKNNPKKNGEIFNFGPITNNKSVENLVKTLNFFWDPNNKLYTSANDRKKFNEASLLALNSKKAYRALGWKCILSYQETIELIYNWYFEFKQNKTNTLITSINQVKYYLEKLS